MEFDCGGYTDGTSGGPFLANVHPATGRGAVIGVIGGYEQGGDTPIVSYSARFGPAVAALYTTGRPQELTARSGRGIAGGGHDLVDLGQRVLRTGSTPPRRRWPSPDPVRSPRR